MRRGHGGAGLGAVAAGQGNHAVSIAQQEVAAFRHGFYHQHILYTWVTQFKSVELVGNDACDGTAFGQHSIGYGTHEAHAAAAKHDSDATLGKGAAQQVGLLGEVRFGAFVGTAVHGDGRDFCHKNYL